MDFRPSGIFVIRPPLKRFLYVVATTSGLLPLQRTGSFFVCRGSRCFVVTAIGIHGIHPHIGLFLRTDFGFFGNRSTFGAVFVEGPWIFGHSSSFRLVFEHEPVIFGNRSTYKAFFVDELRFFRLYGLETCPPGALLGCFRTWCFRQTRQ